jgi:formylglycine-generating enzyme required for sulfatase activity
VGSLLPHEVTLTKAFAIGVYQVTQSEFQYVMGMNPSLFIGTSNPVERIYWNDAVGFCRKLSARQDERRAKRIYRLPTEAEWEHACRAGTTTAFGFAKAGDAIDVDDYLWHRGNSNGTTHPVGLKKLIRGACAICMAMCRSGVLIVFRGRSWSIVKIDPQGPKRGTGGCFGADISSTR